MSMQREAKAASVVLVSLLALSYSPTPSGAQGFNSMLWQSKGGKGAGNAQTQQLIRSNISTRQAQLESDISAGVTAGKLTPQEESDLRAELNNIEMQEGQFLADGNLDNNETQILVDSLTRLTQRLQSYMSNTAYTGSGGMGYKDWFRRYGGPNSGAGNQQARQARIDSRIAELSAKIQQGIVQGRLDQNSSWRLQSQLNQIQNDESLALRDGRLDYGEQQGLLSRLDSLDDSISRGTRNWGGPIGGGGGAWNGGNKWNGGGNWNGGGAWNQPLLKQRIMTGVSSGKLKQWEANVLLSKEMQIENVSVRCSTS
ncbi:MAG: hypothetical protein U0105_09780 [Candidatus Obscuribacterales bacterium]